MAATNVFEMNDESFGDGRIGLDEGVVVGGSQPNSTPIQRGVRTTANSGASIVGDSYPVAMAPDPGYLEK